MSGILYMYRQRTWVKRISLKYSWPVGKWSRGRRSEPGSPWGSGGYPTPAGRWTLRGQRSTSGWLPVTQPFWTSSYSPPSFCLPRNYTLYIKIILCPFENLSRIRKQIIYQYPPIYTFAWYAHSRTPSVANGTVDLFYGGLFVHRQLT